MGPALHLTAQPSVTNFCRPFRPGARWTVNQELKPLGAESLSPFLLRHPELRRTGRDKIRFDESCAVLSLSLPLVQHFERGSGAILFQGKLRRSVGTL